MSGSRVPTPHDRNPVRPPPHLIPRSTASFVMPIGPLFVGSYLRVPVRISAASGLHFDDLEFRVSAPEGGFISPSRDATFNPKEPSIMLLVGCLPGHYVLSAWRKGTTTRVGATSFAVTSTWREVSQGPSLWFQGSIQGYRRGAAWGGGGSGAQNEEVFAPGPGKRVAIILIESSSQHYGLNATDLAALKKRWKDEVVDGVTVNGQQRSTGEYYREVSFGAHNMTAEVFGPFTLSDPIETYIDSNGDMAGSYPQSAITAANSVVNFDDFDNILLVMRSRDVVGAVPRYAAWPYSSIGQWGPYTTNQGSKNFGLTSMPNDWHESDGRQIHATYAHEFGHTLGLDDQYQNSPPLGPLDTGSWELMDYEANLPFFAMPHRMMLGWMSADHIQTFDFAGSGAPVDTTITLAAVEQHGAAPGLKKAVEIRIADGRNYYFEYRVGLGGDIGDQALPTNSRVVGIDFLSDKGAAPTTRPQMELLPQHLSDDGAVLGNGQHYAEIDTTDGLEFRADVSGIDGSKADLRIRYGANGRPDPSIRPWPASNDRQWQSPDIEVQNAKSLADPANWFNTPWVGHENTIIATIRTNGSLDAQGVLVNFYVKDYNVGGTPEFYIGSVTQDVPRGAAVTFTCVPTWTPATSGHFCIVVRIPLYQTPSSPSIAEQTEFNNVAQSNYEHFNTATASPASRSIVSIAVGNPFDQPTRVFLTAGQSLPEFRTYLERTWVLLQAGEVRYVNAMFEMAGHSACEPPNRGAVDVHRPNNIGIVGFIEDPRRTPRHNAQFHGAVQARVVAGRATRIVEFKAQKTSASGQVQTVDDHSPAGSGMILLSTSHRGKRSYTKVDLVHGQFRIGHLPADWDTAQAHYLPSVGFIESESVEVHAH